VVGTEAVAMTKFLAVGYAVGGLVVLGMLAFLLVDRAGSRRSAGPGQEKRVLPYHDARNRTLRDVAIRLTLEAAGNKTVLDKREAGQWVLTQPVDAPADPLAIEQLLDALTQLESVRSLDTADERPDTLGKYGLRPAKLRCTVDWEAQSRTLLLGKDAPGKSGKEKRTYAHVEGSPRVVVIDATVAATLGKSADALRDRRVFRQGVLQAKRVSILGPHGSIVIEDARDHWRMVEPRQGRVDSEALIGLLKAIHEVRIVRFVPSEKVAQGPSPLKCTLETWDNENTTLVVWGPVPESLERVYASGPPEAGLFTLAWDDLAGLRVAPDALLENTDYKTNVRDE